MSKEPMVLSEEDKEKIKKKVEAKLEKEAKDRALEEYERKLIEEIKRREFLQNAKPGDPNDKGLVPVFIGVPSCGDGPRIEGRLYGNNKIHYVTPQLADVLYECMGRGREHEESINGKTAKENLYRRQSRPIVGQ